MLDVVCDAICKFYIKKDYRSFKALCEKKLDLPQEIKDYLKEQGLPLKKKPHKVAPSQAWSIDCGTCKEDEFEVFYSTSIQMSKVAPLFYMKHEFKIENKDEDRLDRILTGFDGQAYTFTQFNLDEKVCKIFSKKGISQMNYVDMIESAGGFKMPEDKVATLGNNVTPEHLLFMDLFNVCIKESIRQEVIH